MYKSSSAKCVALCLLLQVTQSNCQTVVLSLNVSITITDYVHFRLQPAVSSASTSHCKMSSSVAHMVHGLSLTGHQHPSVARHRGGGSVYGCESAETMREKVGRYLGVGQYSTVGYKSHKHNRATEPSTSPLDDIVYSPTLLTADITES